MNYYLNVSLIGSSTKNDWCQDVTLSISSSAHFQTAEWYISQITLYVSNVSPILNSILWLI